MVLILKPVHKGVYSVIIQLRSSEHTKIEQPFQKPQYYAMFYWIQTSFVGTFFFFTVWGKTYSGVYFVKKR